MDSLGISDPREIPSDQKPLQRLKVTFSRGTPWVWKCQHCVSAPCVEACVSGSLIFMEGGGGVIHNPDTCVGCGSCLFVCPYDALSYDEEKERVTKCNLCLEKEIPPCVEACQSKALVYQKSDSFLLKKRKRAVRHVVEVHEAD
jgi:Fe-S-cluster-containing hydrogenase component 2